MIKINHVRITKAVQVLIQVMPTSQVMTVKNLLLLLKIESCINMASHHVPGQRMIFKLAVALPYDVLALALETSSIDTGSNRV